MAGSLKSHLASNMTCCVYSSGSTSTVSEMRSEKSRLILEREQTSVLTNQSSPVVRIKQLNGSPRHHQSDCNGYINHDSKEHRYRDLLLFEQTPTYLRNNPFIRTGYRVFLSTSQCLESLFWWSNESVNIWTHLAGFVLFLWLLIHDILVTIPTFKPTFGEQVVMISLLISYQATMALSVAFHVFGARSENAYYDCLRWDVAGIILSFAAIFISGIHYAYACFQFWRSTYEALIAALSIVVLWSHIKSRDRSLRSDRNRLVLFSVWALFGVVPTAHWAYLEGGFANPILFVLLPRVGIMYTLVFVAFFFYVSRLPERCCPGRVDFVGASHQLWHLFIVAALWWWHETGTYYAMYRQQHTCAQETLVVLPNL